MFTQRISRFIKNGPGKKASIISPELKEIFFLVFCQRRTMAGAKMSRFDEKQIDYEKIQSNLEKWRKSQPAAKKLTLAEKILYGHLDDPTTKVNFILIKLLC